MAKRLIILVALMAVVSLLQAQTVESKKCKTCGKPIKECRYNGEHLQKQSSKTPSQKNSPTTASKANVRMDGNDLVFSCDNTEYRYKMVYVSGGTYTMGCTFEHSRDMDQFTREEKPVHNVTVNSFYMGQTEVTQALWKAVMGDESTNSVMRHWYFNLGYGANYPAYNVSYEDAEIFIRKLNSLTGCSFRLPTEEEWEYAARGGNRSHGYKFSGSDDLDCVAWSGQGKDGTLPVAQKLANELGLYDMSGNVQEWCSSLWCKDYNSNRTGLERVYRGGGWINGNTWLCRISNRFKGSPSYYDSELGLRLAQ